MIDGSHPGQEGLHDIWQQDLLDCKTIRDAKGGSGFSGSLCPKCDEIRAPAENWGKGPLLTSAMATNKAPPYPVFTIGMCRWAVRR
jgi:hypothetical protein